MAKKELRLAVVIYGGASLAVYMHGVSKELLKLVRASRLLHEVGIERARELRYDQGPDRRAADTENVYFEALKELNRDGQFRVVIDVIAGASAGAINGVMLAKALVDDALLDAQTSLWLDDADVEHLSAQRASRWRKWYLYPFLRALSFWLPREIGSDVETRGKLTRLVRSAWFQPPFSGERLCHHFFDGLAAMAATRRAGSTLLPPGQRLDVYASLTDLRGYPRTIHLHEQLVARETEHAAFCQLSHEGAPAADHASPETGTPSAGREDAAAAGSDFADVNAPALVWAARASSSYAGAFPPFHHREMRRVLHQRGLAWPGEAQFLRQSVRARDGTPAHRHFDPAERYFVDGGIVNNKPFGAALAALNHRPADRQVARSLVYIEPAPHPEETTYPDRPLGYLGTLRAALSSIPRNQPILDDLNEVVAQDARVRVNRRIVDANRPEISALVQRVQDRLREEPGRPECDAGLHAAQVTALRLRLVDEAHAALGLGYRAYAQRRAWRLADALVAAWADIASNHDPGVLRQMSEALTWPWDGEPDSAGQRAERQQRFLDRFDVAYRIRRLQFLIRRINQREDVRGLPAPVTDALERFKQRAYGFMARCYRLRRAEGLEAGLREALDDAVKRLPLPAEAVGALLEQLAAVLGLEALDRDLDAALCEFCGELATDSIGPDPIGPDPVGQAVLTDYAGFPLYDALLLATGSLDSGPDPLTRIRVDRISPDDAVSLRSLFSGLRCRDFMGFVGFFNRGYREHDYLWGRLNGAERAIDLLVSAAPGQLEAPDRLKRELFLTIVREERARLPRCAALLDRIEASLLETG